MRPASAATAGGAPGPGRDGGLVFESVHVVVRLEPEQRGLWALVLVRARNAGREPLPRVPLPWLEGAELQGAAGAPAPVVEDGRLVDQQPLPPGTERRYTYQVRIDTRDTGGRLVLLPPASVQRFYLFTREGELAAHSDKLADGGVVDGAQAGSPGVRLRLYEAGPRPAGANPDVALLPPDMAAAPGNREARAPGDAAALGAAGVPPGAASAPPSGRTAGRSPTIATRTRGPTGCRAG